MNVPKIARQRPQKIFDYIQQDEFHDNVDNTLIELQEAFEDLRDQDNHQSIDILIEGEK